MVIALTYVRRHHVQAELGEYPGVSQATVSRAVTSLVHVDHAYGVGARLSLEAVAPAVLATADSLEEFRAFTDGPDAEVEPAVADRLGSVAATLRAGGLVAEERNSVTDAISGTADP
ncbi:MAG: hypothetical protein ACFCVG_13540 [Kineosporiaceae bacterium]